MRSPGEHIDIVAQPADGTASEPKQLADSELFIRHAFKKNAEEGFTLLFRRYHAVLCNHALRFVWSKEVAQDIVWVQFKTTQHNFLKYPL